MLSTLLLPPRVSTRPQRILLAILCLFTVGWFNWAMNIQPQPTALPSAAAGGTPALPLVFVPNLGQRPAEVRMEVQLAAGRATFSRSTVDLKLASGEMRIVFVDANEHTTTSGIDPQAGVVNFFTGNDPSQWRSNIPTYASMVYEQLFAGIDLRYDGANGNLKGTYTVAPYADPSHIRWQYQGVGGVALNQATGDLEIDLGDTTLVERAPIAWQEIDGQHIPVDVRYALDGKTLGFTLGRYNAAYPLIIDPELVFSTYLGGGSTDTPQAIAVDGQRNVYVVGATLSNDFPGAGSGQAGSTDMVVVKLNPSGTGIVYSTYIGGRVGEEALSVAVNAAGEAYILGGTDSADFPIRNALQSTTDGENGVLIKLDATGKLLFSTYLAIDVYNFKTRQSLVLDADSNAYVVGKGGGYAVKKISADGSKLLIDRAFRGIYLSAPMSIALDSANNIYLTGTAGRGDFEVTPDAIQPVCGNQMIDPDAFCSDDAFVMILSPEGEVFYATYWGGNASDEVEAITVAPNGDIIIVGSTSSVDFPTAQAIASECPSGIYGEIQGCNSPEAFVTRFSPGGQGVVFSTYLAGPERGAWDEARGVVTDASGNAYVGGFTNAPQFPIKDAAQREMGAGFCMGFSERRCYDGFVTAFAPNGSLIYSTFHGGNFDEHINGIAVDSASNVYITGETRSFNYPTTSDALQPSKALNDDFFIAKLGTRGNTGGPTPNLPYRLYAPLVQR